MKKYNKIWNKVSSSIEKGLNSEHMDNEKYLRTKLKSYECNISINFPDDRMQNEGSHCVICLSGIYTYSVFKIGKNYYQEGFLEERKYIFKEKR